MTATLWISEAFLLFVCFVLDLCCLFPATRKAMQKKNTLAMGNRKSIMKQVQTLISLSQELIVSEVQAMHANRLG